MDRKLYSSLMRLALPMMGANLLQTLYNLADTYFLGKLGKEAVSAPSISFNLTFFLIVFGTGFTAAGTTLIAQAKGKGEHDKVNFYVGQTFTILLVVSLVIMVTGLLLTDLFLRLLQVPEGLTYTYTETYMRIIFSGMPFMFISFSFAGILQGIGDSMTPLCIQLVTVCVNILLDIVLIFGLGPIEPLGVAGAAYATIISRAISSAIAIYLLSHRYRGLELTLRKMRPHKEAWKRIISIGLPSSLGQGISALGFTTLQGIVNTFGPAVIAAFGVSGKLIALFNMPGQGISQATAVLVGQSIGAREHERAVKTVLYALLTIAVFIVSGMSMTFFYGSRFIRFFVDDPEVISYGASLFRVVSVSVVFFSLFTVLVGAFQGGGDTKPIMVLQIFRLWGIRVPVAYLLAVTLAMGPTGIWWAMFLSNFVVSFLMFFLFRTGRWKYRIDPDSL